MEEYTIREYANIKGYKLKTQTLMDLGRNAQKIEKSLKVPIEKKYKKQNKQAYRKRGKNKNRHVRIWPLDILKEVII